jgi:hypothetical protein
MRNCLLFLSVLLFVYSCSEISGKETPGENKRSSVTDEANNQPREDLRVGRDEAQEMRRRRKNDDASVKIAAKDLQALINSTPAENDSFVFYFVSYGRSDKEQKRYEKKLKRSVDWDNITKKPSSLLVGFISGRSVEAMHLMGKNKIPTIPVYDLGVVCPPPPNCGCEIEQ